MCGERGDGLGKIKKIQCTKLNFPNFRKRGCPRHSKPCFKLLCVLILMCKCVGGVFLPGFIGVGYCLYIGIANEKQ